MSTSSTVTNNTAADPTTTTTTVGGTAKDSIHETATSSYDTDKIAIPNNEPRASVSTIGSSDPRTQDIKSWRTGFQRMADERLEKQRYQLSDSKDDEITTIALGAKVERALGRRMTGQDATFKRRVSLGTQGGVQQQEPVELPEKRSMEVSS